MAKQPTEKICSKCLIHKNIKREFYLAANDFINADNRLPICKECLSSLVDMQNVESLINVMRAVDRPFLKSTYDGSLTKPNQFGEYMRMLATPQNREKTYLHSEFEGNHEEFIPKTVSELNKAGKAKEDISFKITPDLVIKWGGNFSDSEIYQLESFFVAMNEANDITTPQHVESLKLLCKLNVLQNKALEEGSVTDFKNLNTQFNKLMETSGLRPIDRKSSGESAGIRTFSQIWEEVEKEGFIEPYPYQERQDIVDKTIMYLGNYTRKLVNMQSMSQPPEDTPKVEDGDDE